MADMPTPEAPRSPGRRKLLIGLGAGAATLAAGGAVAAVLSGQRNSEVSKASPTPTRTPEATATKTSEPTRTPETTPTKEPVKTPEEVADCKVFPKEFCARAELILLKGGPQGDVKYVAFRDLPAGTSLSSLVDGQRTIIDRVKETVPPSPFQGFSLLSIYPKDRSITHTFIGNLNIPDSPVIKSGESIGSVSEAKNKLYGEYTLIYTATRTDASGKTTVDEKSLKELFPKAFGIPPKEFPFSGQGSAILTNPNYQNKP